MSVTKTHTLQLISGVLRLEITETLNAVFFAFSGVKPLGFEKRKLSAFLLPLIDAYRDDKRRMEFSGQHSVQTSHVRPVAGGKAWVGYHTGTEGQQ